MDAMLANYFTKPLSGLKFQKFCKAVMNCGWTIIVGQQECVGEIVLKRLMSSADCMINILELEESKSKLKITQGILHTAMNKKIQKQEWNKNEARMKQEQRYKNKIHLTFKK
jgi:hypothetical protein